MTESELRLLALFGPLAPLAEICLPCFGLTYAEAKREAVLNRLPFPTFRLRDTSPAPVLVLVSDLAAYLDGLPECDANALVIKGRRWGDGPQVDKRTVELRRRLFMHRQVVERLERLKQILDEQAEDGGR